MNKRQPRTNRHSDSILERRDIDLDAEAMNLRGSGLQIGAGSPDSMRSQRAAWCEAELTSWDPPQRPESLIADWQTGVGTELRAPGSREKARGEDETRKALQARDRMLSFVSHDLRDPLNTISLACSLLSEDIPAKVRKAQLATIRRSVDRMQLLIGDLFDVSLTEGGGLRISPSPCLVDDLVHAAVDSMQLLAATRAIQLGGVSVPKVRVSADPDRIQQVLANLISNAVRFTPVGGDITVSASASGASEICFSVQDTGAGIAAEHAPLIFDRFWQAAPADRTGAGLGLAISKGIVAAHGGRIWVASGPGAGARISFTIPLAGAQSPASVQLPCSV